MEYLLLDTTPGKPRPLKRASQDAARLWSDILCYETPCALIPFDDRPKRYLTRFSDAELIALYYATTGERLGMRPYSALLDACVSALQTFPVDSTPFTKLMAQHAEFCKEHPEREPDPKLVNRWQPIISPRSADPAPVATTGPFVGPWANQPTETSRWTGQAPNPSNTPKKDAPVSHDRPKPGTATGRVWDIADSFYTPGQPITKEVRAKIIQACVDAGINQATAGVQYSKWKGSKTDA